MKTLPHRKDIKRKTFYKELCKEGIYIEGKIYYKLSSQWSPPYNFTSPNYLTAVFMYNPDNMNFYPVRTKPYFGEWTNDPSLMFSHLSFYNFPWIGDWSFTYSHMRKPGCGLVKHEFFKRYAKNMIRDINVYDYSEYLTDNFASML